MAGWLNGRTKNWLGRERTRKEPPERDEPDGVIFYPLRCPRCGSVDIRTHTTKPPGPNRRRYHTCKVCKKNFHSTEAPPP